MTSRRRIVLAKTAILIAILPFLLWAYEYGPNPGYVGVPGENGGATCATSGCHTGTTNDPANKGSVTVTFPEGLTYTPGVLQKLSVTISDPVTTQKAAGFQLTARVAATPLTMAGILATLDNCTQVLCAQPNLQIYTYQNTSGASCKTGYTLQYIEQTGTQTDPPGSQGGYENSIAHGLPYTYNFTWTPPAANVGNITIYVAGNAGLGNPPTNVGDHIYANTYTLAPLGSATTPSLSSLAPNSAIAGSPAFTLTVNGSGFLNGATVLWNGTALVTTYVSGNQLTATVPAALIAAPGNANATIVDPGGTLSAPLRFIISAATPTIIGLIPNSLTVGGGQFTLTVNGSGFLPGCAVQWNGSALSTNYLGSTQITASVPANLVANVSSTSVAVINPGGTASNYLAFSITSSTGTSAISYFITTAVGTGFSGFNGDGGQGVIAQLAQPSAIAIDIAGNLYVADTYNNRIRRVTPVGIITTVAGTGGVGTNIPFNGAFSGDGGLLHRPRFSNRPA
jgi:NHL repeat